MRNLLIILLFLIASSCTSENTNSEVREIYYFDLKTYFTKEAEKFSKKKPMVNKSITHNGSVEEKQMQINNWTDELALFIESDINKISWKNSYKRDSTSNKLTYTAKEDNLKTQSIEIVFSENKPAHFRIINKTHNYLYKTDEILEYIPDSLYLINKKQQVILLGKNDYLIQGLFN